MNKKIFFIGINSVTLPLVHYTQDRAEVHVSNSTYIKNDKSTFTYHKLAHGFFGLGAFLGKVLHNQVSLPFYQKGLCRKLEEIRPDIVVCMDFFRLWTVQALWYKAKHPKTKLILQCETKITPQSIVSRLAFYPMVYLNKICKSKIDHIIAYCELGQTYLQKLFGRTVDVCPVPIEGTSFFDTGDRFLRKDNVLRILMVSRFVPYKKHIDVVQAVQKLKKQGVQVKATFVGQPTEYMNSIFKYIHDAGLTANISHVESQSRDALNELYNSHDVLILSSYNDAIGIVVLEAMTAGLPCIVSDTSGAAAYVRQGINGYTYTTGNVDELVSCLKQIHTSENLKLMSEKAVELTKKEFSFEHMGLLFYNVLTK